MHNSRNSGPEYILQCTIYACMQAQEKIQFQKLFNWEITLEVCKTRQCMTLYQLHQKEKTVLESHRFKNCVQSLNSAKKLW